MNIDKVRKMSPEEKNARISEMCGWKFVDPMGSKGRVSWSLNEKGQASMCWVRPGDEPWNTRQIPDYLNDLNACFEMENLVLKKADGEPLPDTWDRYCENLALLSGFPKTYLLVHSSAAQRSNAFLATMLP